MGKTVKQENIIYFCNEVSHLTDRSHTDNNTHNFFNYNATSDWQSFFFFNFVYYVLFYFVSFH